MSRRSFEGTPYIGRFFEEDNFGKSEAKDAGYLKFEEAVEDVKKNQPWDDPSDPHPRFANDLHAEVAIELGLEDDYAPLEFYTAIGSSLDHYHGVDAFFEYEGARATLDITQNPAKQDGYKADLIVGPEEVEYSVRRQEKAAEIADVLRAEVAKKKKKRPHNRLQRHFK